MSLSKREFLQVLGAAGVAGMGLARHADADAATAEQALYDVPKFGQVSLLHMTDCHAQLLPIRFREPSVNLGLGSMAGELPHLVGEHLLKKAGLRPGSAQAHAYTFLDFETASQRYGKVGGFAELATLVKRLKASRPGALLLDGGDTWQGSATSLWTNAQDMVDACKLLGVDVMTGHWEFTYGMERVKEIVEKDFKGKVDFVAQNVKTTDFGDPVFSPYVIKPINGVPVAIIGQAFPYTPIANPRYMVADWSFGIQDDNLQKMVDEARGKGAQVVVVLSHNGMDVDLKMASRVRGIDAILGGHTHDGMPVPVLVKNAGGTTIVTNAGSNSKFLGVIDFDVKGGKVADFRYTLLPVFANQIQPDAEMAALIRKVRAPYESKLAEKMRLVTEKHALLVERFGVEAFVPTGQFKKDLYAKGPLAMVSRAMINCDSFDEAVAGLAADLDNLFEIMQRQEEDIDASSATASSGPARKRVDPSRRAAQVARSQAGPKKGVNAQPPKHGAQK